MGSEIIIVPVVFATIGFVVWILAVGWLRRSQIHAMTDFNNKLLDRIGSVKDFSDFLQTDGGAQFIARVTAGGTRPEIRLTILRSLQTGLVLLALGAGLLVLGGMFRGEDWVAFPITGVITLSLGVGFLLSAVAAYSISSKLQRRLDE